MKSLLLTLLVSPLLSLAAPATKDMDTVSRLLINNPSVGETLKKSCLGLLKDLTSAPIQRGVTRYTLIYNVSGFCVPVTGIVTIDEDLRPTMSDRPPKYTVNVDVKP